MSLSVRFLHSHPQTGIATLIRDLLMRCARAQIVSGFATPDGLDAIRAAAAVRKINRLVLGAATFKAFEALDNLIASGLPENVALVHLGHTRRTDGKKNPFERLRPMLHSKIYLFDMEGEQSTALIGSHNLTGFALRGLNGEAGVLLEGPSIDPIFAEIGAHIDESARQAVSYDPSLKEAYANWYAEYLKRLRTDTGDMPKDTESRRTIVLFAKGNSRTILRQGQRIYFELDKRIEQVEALGTEVHLHIFAELPASPRAALSSMRGSSRSLLARVEAIDSGAGSVEVKADWHIDDSRAPTITPTSRPFRPNLSVGKQQVRALVSGDLNSSYDYLFDEDAARLEPILGDEVIVDPETDAEWKPVIGFDRRTRLDDGSPLLISALPELSPDSGSFILLSRKRRKLR